MDAITRNFKGVGLGTRRLRAWKQAQQREQSGVPEKADKEPRKPGKQKEIQEISVTDTGKRGFPGSTQESQMPQTMNLQLGDWGSKFNGVLGGFRPTWIWQFRPVPKVACSLEIQGPVAFKHFGVFKTLFGVTDAFDNLMKHLPPLSRKIHPQIKCCISCRGPLKLIHGPPGLKKSKLLSIYELSLKLSELKPNCQLPWNLNLPFLHPRGPAWLCSARFIHISGLIVLLPVNQLQAITQISISKAHLCLLSLET